MLCYAMLCYDILNYTSSTYNTVNSTYTIVAPDRVGGLPPDVGRLEPRARGVRHLLKSIIMIIKVFTLLDVCMSSVRRGHANLLCIVPILSDDPRGESEYYHGYTSLAPVA